MNTNQNQKQFQNWYTKMNSLQTDKNFVKPIIGQGVTIGIGSDCYPGTIVEISNNNKKIVIQMDDTEPAENFDYFNNQVYTITSDPRGRKETWTYRKNGVWAKFRAARAVGYLSFNGRRKYSDPSF